MRRHELTDEQWQRLELLLPRPKGRHGKRGDRDFLNAVIFIAKTGMPWRDLPDRFGPWKTVFNRFADWCRREVFDKILNALAQDADNENTSADASYIRAHQHSAGGKGGPKTNVLAALGAALQPKSMPSLTDSEIRHISTLLPAMFMTASKPRASSKPRADKTSSPTKATTQMLSSLPSKRKE